ncbi:MAG: MaoC family dehydratase [Pseudomonadota bacterium]
MKTFTGNYFEDFELGQVITHGTPRTITQGDNSLYIALTGSRYCIHSAEPVARALGFEHMPVDNFLAFHIAFGKTVPDISLNAVANLGYAEVLFRKPLYAGDTLFVESKVIGLKENSNGKSGIVYVHSIAKDQNLDVAIEWKRWVMVHKRDTSATTELNSTPDLPKHVSAEKLSIPAQLNFSEFEPRLSGSHDLWDDYNIGEEIDHIDGLTIDESDHTLATKLYQNNAKVHFNAFEMKSTPGGKRLMYGGHVISVCRALSHNGLANALYVSAINGGTHANPTYAGDTIYAQSQVIDKWQVDSDSHIGAIRVRTVGMKNTKPSDLPSIMVEKEGKQRYHPQVVLDLDYTLLMPIR